MTTEAEKEAKIYLVVVNDEDQYSMWPADRARPAGWKETGRQGTRQECLVQIKELWNDLRPRSLRLKMAQREGQG
ncbi:MAG: MbtH family protein [Myxococcales bacterium]|nr:MbtH family protein [Myxococcales bacterium]